MMGTDIITRQLIFKRVWTLYSFKKYKCSGHRLTITVIFIDQRERERGGYICICNRGMNMHMYINMQAYIQ